MARSPSKRQTARRQEVPVWRLWLDRHIRIILIALAVITVSYLVALIVLTLHPRLGKESTGGVDGCLVADDGRPLPGQVRVGTVSTDTGGDGCFFFAALPIGTQVLEIEAGGTTWEQPVTVVSGEAVPLGSISQP